MRKNFLEVELQVPRDARGWVELRCEACGLRFGVESPNGEMWCPRCGVKAPLFRLLLPEVRTRLIQQLRFLIWGKGGSS